MAYPVLTAQGATADGTGAASVAWPSHLTDDIGLLIVETANEAVATPSGWTPLGSASPQGTGTGGGTTATRLTVFWRRAASGSEANATFADPGDHFYARIWDIRGVWTGGDPISTAQNGDTAATNTAITYPSLTTLTAESLVVLLCGWATDGTAQGNNDCANANLATITLASNLGTTQGNGGGFVGFWGNKATAGVVGTSTSSLIGTSVQARIVLAFSPTDPAASQTINATHASLTLAAQTISLTAAYSLQATNAALTLAAQNATVAGGNRTVQTTAATLSLTIPNATVSQLGGGFGEELFGRTVTWASSSPSVAAAPASGPSRQTVQVPLLAAGTTNLQPTCEGIAGPIVPITVSSSAAAVASVLITVSPQNSGAVGETLSFTAMPKDGGGAALPGRVVGWQFLNAVVASVDAGHGADNPAPVRLRSAGTCDIRAFCEGVGSNTITVTVSAAAVPVKLVLVAPPTLSGNVGGTGLLTATCYDSNLYTGGTVTATAGTVQTLWTYAQRWGIDAGCPDTGPCPIVRASDGQIYWFMAAAPGSVNQTTISLKTPTVDALTSGWTANQRADSGFHKSSDTAKFDCDYAAGGDVFYDMGSGYLFHLYHGEYWIDGRSTPTPFYASFGLAYSTDYGQHFTKLGAVIVPRITYATMEAQHNTLDVGIPTVSVRGDGYVYAFYREPATNPTNYDGLCCARALLSECVTAANGGSAPLNLFKKYYNGGYTEAGVLNADFKQGGGACTGVMGATGQGLRWGVYTRWNSYLNRWVAVGSNAETAILMSFSNDPDGVTGGWTVPITVLTAAGGTDTVFYEALIGTGTDPRVLGQTFYLCYIRPGGNFATSAPYLRLPITVGQGGGAIPAGNILTGRRVDWRSSAPTSASASTPGQTTTVGYLATPGATVTANCETIDSAGVPVTVNAAPPPAGSTYPNLPGTGWTQLLQMEGNQLPAGSMSATGMTIGVGLGQNKSGGSASIVSIGDCPIDAPNVLQVLYPTGLPGGAEPYDLWMRHNLVVEEYAEWYEAGWIRLGRSTADTTFEIPSGGVWKYLGYWGVGQAPSAGSNQMYTLCGGSGGTPATSIPMNMSMQNHLSWTPISIGSVLCGKFYRYELYCKLESAVGTADGLLQFWLTNVTDGGTPQNTGNYANRRYRSITTDSFGNPVYNTHGFFQRSYVPVWGGSGNPRTRNDYVQIARIAAFGRNRIA